MRAAALGPRLEGKRGPLPTPSHREMEGLAVRERNILLTERLEAVIESFVRSGRDKDASDVVRAALRQTAKTGIEALERGEYRTFETFDKMERHLIDQTEPVISRPAKR